MKPMYFKEAAITPPRSRIWKFGQKYLYIFPPYLTVCQECSFKCVNFSPGAPLPFVKRCFVPEILNFKTQWLKYKYLFGALFFFKEHFILKLFVVDGDIPAPIEDDASTGTVSKILSLDEGTEIML